jgi:hypothetical protein
MLNPVMPTTLKNIQKAREITVDIGLGIFQAVTHPGLSRKINNLLKRVFPEKLFHSGSIYQIKLNKPEIRLLQQHRQTIFFQLYVIVIIQVIEPDNLNPISQQSPAQMKTNKPGRPGH